MEGVRIPAGLGDSQGGGGGVSACVSSLWKVELVYRQHYRTRAEAKKAVFDFIEVFYNRTRRHSALGYISPDAFEAAYYRNQAA